MSDTLTRTQVISTDIASIGYDPDTHMLEVEFKRGSKVYQYADVPVEIWQSFIGAVSVGKFFHTNIKGKYSYREVKA